MNFLGYVREDGSVGTRNYVGIIPTVGCVNEVARGIAQHVALAVPLLHHQGCCQLSPDLDTVTKTLTSLGKNPNFGAVLLVGLGCEGISIDRVMEGIAETGKPVEAIVIQDLGGSTNSVQQGTAKAERLAFQLSAERKKPVDVSNIVVGIKCGSSDATSGLSSNPSTGYASDKIVNCGGTVIFGETTEFLGAEHVLAERAVNKDVADKLLGIVDSMEKRAASMGVDMRGGQPTPGNINGGLTTIEEKSLGAIVKGGSCLIHDVLEYWESPSTTGLFIKDTPGREIEALTGLAAARAQIIVFSTGRGAPQGFPGVPVVKVCGNSRTVKRMADHIDLDVSGIVEGRTTISEEGERLFSMILEVASGTRTKAELLHYDETMDIYTTGPVI